MNKPKKYIVLCTAPKCPKIDEHTEVYKYLNKQLEKSNYTILFQLRECDGECENGPYLNIIPDYNGYNNVTIDECRRIVENELMNLNNADKNISKSIQQECNQAEQWKMFTTYCIEEEPCKYCTLCKKVCPAGAISGQVKKVHKIDQSKCIKCGKCKTKCKFDAISIMPISNGVKALRCINCGDLIGTEATRDYVNKKLEHSIAEYDLCNECRHTYWGQALRNKN